MIYSPFGKSPEVAEAEYEYRIRKAWRKADETESNMPQLLRQLSITPSRLTGRHVDFHLSSLFDSMARRPLLEASANPRFYNFIWQAHSRQ
jgi:hypothetical protein